jgi:outer membrane protein OmpA-like peptidoglycan-associated protein
MHATLITLSPRAVRTCVWMALALTPLGCATQQQRVELETEFKARMAKMEASLATEKGRIDKLTTDLAAVRATATEATRIGTEATRIGTAAQKSADTAAAKGEAVDARVTKALANRLARIQVQEFKVMFDVGRAELSEAALQTLQGALKLLADNATYTADVVGYTDDVGAAGSNVTLSWRREEVVRRFLVEQGTALNRFSFIGLGEDRAKATSAAGRAQDRHVRVVVYRPAE